MNNLVNVKREVLVTAGASCAFLFLVFGEEIGAWLAAGTLLATGAGICYGVYKYRRLRDRVLAVVMLIVLVAIIAVLPPAMQVGRIAGAVAQRVLQCALCLLALCIPFFVGGYSLLVRRRP